MATLKTVVDHRKADGTYNVKIRLTHNRKSLYLPTQLYITDKELTKSKKIKDHAILMATGRLIDEMRAVILDTPNAEYMECERLRKIIQEKMSEGKTFRLDFFKYAEVQVAKMHRSNRAIHLSAMNYLADITGGTLDVNDLTYNLICRYRDTLTGKVSHNTVNYYMGAIRHILNIAKSEYNDDDIVRIRVNPFRRDVIPSMKVTKHRVLTAEQIRAIANVKGDRYENFARDVFLLSFCLIGVNLVDLYNLKQNNLKDGVLTYNRRKTKGSRQDNALISVNVEDEAMVLIEKYQDSHSDYLLNFHRRYTLVDNMTNYINTFLRRLHRYNDVIPNDFTYYYARHSWATIAYNDCGIDMQTIHEALNHASDANMKITDVYVKKDFSRIWEANRKVLDYVFGRKRKRKKRENTRRSIRYKQKPR